MISHLTTRRLSYRSLAFLVLILAFGTIGCPTVRNDAFFRPERISINGKYQHEESGMEFHESVGDYVRDILMRYDQKSLDVSGGYNLIQPTGKIWATVYVYPSQNVVSILSPPGVTATVRSIAVKGEITRTKDEILASHSSARLIGEEEKVLAMSNRSYLGWAAIFELDGSRFGQRENVSSHLFIFPYASGNWTVKYRFTYPKSMINAPKNIENFMNDFKWTLKEPSSLQLPGIFESTR